MASLEPKKLIPQLIQQSQIHRQKLIIIFGICGFIGAIGVLKPLLWPDGFGITADQSVTTTVEKDAQGKITKVATTTKTDPGKTLWDWLSLLGVPLTLAILGYVLQQIQQKRAEEEAKEQREIAADETKEEVLQVYFDRLSALLVDKNLLAIAAKKNSKETEKSQVTLKQKELLDSALDITRARTLSILRRFKDDKERKTSVIRFLIEADFISKLELNLSGTDLSSASLRGANLRYASLRGADLSSASLRGANLRHANLGRADLSSTDLRGTNLSSADLSSADLSSADLSGADLRGGYLVDADLSSADLSSTNLSYADLIGADLSYANIRDADLSIADLSGADLIGADLSYADLSGTKNLTEKQLTQAKLCKTKLPPGINLDPDRDCEEQEARLKAAREAQEADGTPT